MQTIKCVCLIQIDVVAVDEDKDGESGDSDAVSDTGSDLEAFRKDSHSVAYDAHGKKIHQCRHCNKVSKNIVDDTF